MFLRLRFFIMKIFKYFIVLSLFLLLFTSCNDDNSCDGVDCSGHGTCSVVNGAPQCTCNDGYVNDGPLYCSSPCDGVDCSNHGSCSYDEDYNPYCTCEEGYENNGPIECIKIQDN